MLLAPPMAKSLALALVRFLEEPHRLRLEDAFATAILDSLGAVALALLAPLGLALVAGVGASVLQTGVLIAPERVRPKLENLSPVKGWSRLASRRNLVEFVKGIGKVTLVAAVAL